jgi:hypothetical protein
MRHKKLKLSALLLFSIVTTGLHAQEVIPASGGNVSGSGGSVSYSVGQILYTTNTGVNGSLAEGVQQPYEISVETGFTEVKGIILQCSVYPNPTTDYLKLKVENSETRNLNYQLYDVNGKLLENKNIENNETNIILGNFATSTFFLKVTDNNKELKIFKIIKK